MKLINKKALRAFMGRQRYTLLSLVVIIIMFMVIQLNHGAQGQLAGQINKGSAIATQTSGAPQIGGDFELVDDNGNAFTQENLKGHDSIIFFGFTNCPDVCPLTLTKLQEMHTQLPEQMRGNVRYYFVSVDPERDTVDVLHKYMNAFADSDTGFTVTGLTGTPEQVEQIKKVYLVYSAKRGEGEFYQVDHSSFVYVMNSNGQYLTHLKHASPVTEWAEAVNKALFK